MQRNARARHTIIRCNPAAPPRRRPAAACLQRMVTEIATKSRPDLRANLEAITKIPHLAGTDGAEQVAGMYGQSLLLFCVFVSLSLSKKTPKKTTTKNALS